MYVRAECGSRNSQMHVLQRFVCNFMWTKPPCWPLRLTFCLLVSFTFYTPKSYIHTLPPPKCTHPHKASIKADSVFGPSLRCRSCVAGFVCCIIMHLLTVCRLPRTKANANNNSMAVHFTHRIEVVKSNRRIEGERAGCGTKKRWHWSTSTSGTPPKLDKLLGKQFR